MKRLTNAQVLAAKAFCANPAHTRQEKVALLHSLEQYSANGAQATAILQLIYETRDPRDKGAWGKTFEAQIRIYRICVVLGRLIKVSDLWARPQGLADIRIRHGNTSYTIECKTGQYDSDFMVTLSNNLDAEIERISNLNRVLIWATPKFTIVTTYNEFIQALSGYKGGVKTFIHLNKDGSKTRLQKWVDSGKKTEFLQALAKNSYQLKRFLETGELVHW